MKDALPISDLAALIALDETELMRETAFVKTGLSEDSLTSFALSGQNVRHLPDCYPVVADHAQATQAIVPMIQEHRIQSRLFGHLRHLGSLYRFFASVAVEHRDPLSDLAF